MSKKKLPAPTRQAMDAYDSFVFPCTLDESINDNKEMALQTINETDFEYYTGNTQMFVSNRVIQPLNYFKAKKGQRIDVEDYEKAYDAFCDIINKVNEKMPFTPIKNTFCRFIGIDTDKYNMYCKENSDRGEFFRKVNDNLGENVLQGMIGNRIAPVTGIFICKSNFGMRDNDGNTVNILNVNSEPKGLQEILEEYKKLGH